MTEYGSARNGAEGIEEVIQGTEEISVGTGTNDRASDIGNTDTADSVAGNRDIDTADIDIQDSGINGNGDIAKGDTDTTKWDTGKPKEGDTVEGKKGKRGNIGNLIPTSTLTMEERRQLASRAGKASVESRRRKRDLREIAKSLLATDMEPDQVTEILGTAQNLLDGDKSVAAVLTARLAQEAGKGNHKAYEVLRDTAGYKPKDNVSIEGMMTDADRALIAQVSSRLGLHNDTKQGE